MVTAAGTLGSIAVAAASVPALTTLATAATARKRRRVGSTGRNIMGWSSADVFVGGVIYTLSALAIGFRLLVVGVRLVSVYRHRGGPLVFQALFCYTENHEEVNKGD